MRKNINEAEWKIRVDLAAMFRLTHMMGWDDTIWNHITACLLYTSPSPRDATLSRMPSCA